MSIRENIGLLLEIAEKARDLDLKKAILDVQEDLLEEQDRNLDLGKRILEQKKRIADLEEEVELFTAKEADLEARTKTLDEEVAKALREEARGRIRIGGETARLAPHGENDSRARLMIQVAIIGGAEVISKGDKVTVFEVFASLPGVVAPQLRLDRADTYHSCTMEGDLHFNTQVLLDDASTRKLLEP